MSINIQEIKVNFSVFSNMFSIINPSQGSWPVNLILPDPLVIPPGPTGKLPSIFPDESKRQMGNISGKYDTFAEENTHHLA